MPFANEFRWGHSQAKEFIPTEVMFCQILALLHDGGQGYCWEAYSMQLQQFLLKSKAYDPPQSPFMFSNDLYSITFVHHNFDLGGSRYRTSLPNAPSMANCLISS